MKIGVDIRELQSEHFTGIGRYLVNFLQYAGQNDQENEYILYGNEVTYCSLHYPNLKIRIIPEKITFFWDQWILPKALKDDNIDVFFSPYYKGPLRSPCPVITVIHDLIPLRVQQYQGLSYLLKRLFFKSFIQKSKKHVARILTVSQHSKKDLMQIFSIPDSQITVVYNSVTNVYEPKQNECIAVLEKYKLPENYILYFGNLNPHKNVPMLIRAYAQLNKDIRRQYPLVIAGAKNRWAKQVQELIQELYLQENVLLPNFIDEEDLPFLYSGAHLFCFPSLYEGFGLPVLEAMACATPVLTSTSSSLPEVVGDSALLLDPDDPRAWANAMERLLTDHDLRHTLRHKGRERSSEFPVSRMGEGLVQVFHSVYKEFHARS